MSDQATVEIRLSQEAQALFSRYQQFTGTGADHYIEALVEKTLPTVKALVAAMEEAGDDSEAVMELFGRKMAEAVLAQQQAQQPSQPAVNG